MMKKVCILQLLIFLIPITAISKEEVLQKGSQQFGISEIGLGYSSSGSLLFSAQTSYQYFFINRVAVGAAGFYRNLGGRESQFEYFGGGPTATYYFWNAQNWFANFGQDLMFAKYNGDRENTSSVTTTSSIGISNFITPNTAFGINVNYSFPLDGREVVRRLSIGAGLSAFF